MYDILLEFRCPDIWLVRASKQQTVILSDEIEGFKVDPNNQCKREIVKKDDDDGLDVKNKQEAKTDDRKLYTRFSFTLFSMLVSGSFLAGFSVKTFYLTVAYVASGTVRINLIFSTWKGFVYEVTDPMAIIKVIEACYMYRFE